MSIPIITKGATTDHGGVVEECFETFTIDGKKVHLDGMKHYCPKCKKEVFAIASNHTKTMMGKAWVLEGDKASCGATFIANQSMGFVGVGVDKNNVLDNDSKSRSNEINKKRIIEDLFWSYGEDCIALSEKSRFYEDVNLHVITKGYNEGETVDIVITNGQNDLEAVEKFEVCVTIDKDGNGIAKNIFQGKTVLIDTE